MTDTYEKCTERCSCGSRQKSKCVKESESGTGKMCWKPYKAMDELAKQAQELNMGYEDETTSN